MTSIAKDFKGRLHDTQRGLSSYLTILPEVTDILKRDQALGLIYVDGRELRQIEERYGVYVFDEVMLNISKILSGTRGTIIRRADMLSLNQVRGYSFIIFLNETRKERQSSVLSKDAVEKACERIQTHLNSVLFFELYRYLQSIPRINIGYSFAVYNPMVDPLRAVYNLVEEARAIAELQTSHNELKNRSKLQKVILQNQVSTLYQPIVKLEDLSILAYEALSRGPKGSEIEAPAILFRLGEETGLIFELDRLCRRQAVQSAKGKVPGRKLFINTLPNLMFKPELEAKQFLLMLDKNNIDPADIVFEITERNAVEKYSNFREALKFYTQHGMQVAIDDVGAGYSSLEAIMEIEPKFVKIDASIIRGAAGNRAKQEMLRALQTMSRSIDALTIAEGIETVEDFEMMKQLGIPYGQGYLFAKPAPGFVEVNGF